LAQIWQYIAHRNLSAANRLIDKVERTVAMLSTMPGMGHIRAEVKDPRFLFWAIAPYVIAYRHTSRTLTIVRIVHGARDFRRVFRARRPRGQ
jgi:toxin ParE1/3/4